MKYSNLSYIQNTYKSLVRNKDNIKVLFGVSFSTFVLYKCNFDDILNNKKVDEKILEEYIIFKNTD